MTLPDPKLRTNSEPVVIDGTTFRCYRVGGGGGGFAWYSDCGRLRAYTARHSSGHSHRASVNGEPIMSRTNPAKENRFRSFTGAMTAAVAKLKVIA